MKARCIQECYDGKKCWKYTPEGGENKDGIYDIDPLDPIAQYFEFPAGTVKYKKILGSKQAGTKSVQTTEKVGEDKELDQDEKPAKKEKDK